MEDVERDTDELSDIRHDGYMCCPWLQNFSADSLVDRLSRVGLPASVMCRVNDPRRRTIEV